MGFYRKFILPTLIDFAMKDKGATDRRAAIIPQAAGSVLEIGIGSGLNLPFYTAAVTRLHGVDASPELLEKTRRKIAGAPFPVTLACEPAERLSVATESIDTIVMTWVLCSIPDPQAALREMKRALKPGGTLLFIEHGRSPDPGVFAWQRRLNPIWGKIGGGCTLNRKPDALIAAAGFTLGRLREGYQPGPRPMTYTYEGVARPEAGTAGPVAGRSA